MKITFLELKAMTENLLIESAVSIRNWKWNSGKLNCHLKQLTI